MLDDDEGGVLSDAAARLSHELKNSLAGIAGALDVLSDRVGLRPELSEVLSRIRVEVERIDGSVRGLAAFARRPVPVLKERDIHSIIDRAIENADIRATTRVARLYDRELPHVRIDERLLVEAFARLFVNAREAMPEGGVLHVRTDRLGDHITLTVRDTGPGIRDVDVERVFDPFVTSKTRGLGLGLAILRRVIEAHGGSVSATPAADGAEFTVRLPVPKGGYRTGVGKTIS